MRRRSLFLCLAAGLLASAVGPAQAAMISFDSTMVPVGAIPSTNNVAIQKFDTSLGTLTGITFTLNETVKADVQVDNITSSSLAFTNAFSSVPTTGTGPGGLSLAVTATANVASGTAAPGLNSYPGTTDMASSTSVYTGPFGPYEGPGVTFQTLTFAAGDGTFGGTGGPGSLFFGGTALAGGYISVTYTYTPAAIPEPSSMALLGIGMVGFFTYRRLFKRHAAV